MMSRWIVHFEWHRGYRPHISIKRAPYPGKVEFIEREGYYKLVPCRSCSAVGYFYGPLSEIERRAMSSGPTYTTEEMLAELEQNAPADMRDEEISRSTAQGLVQFMPQAHPVGHDFGPVWTQETYRQMAVEDGLIPDDK